MSAVSLPPEIVEIILNEATKSLTSVQKDQILTSCTLVCKSQGWSMIARRMLLSTLQVRDGTHIKILIKEVSKGGIGHLVRKLEVRFQKSDYEESYRMLSRSVNVLDKPKDPHEPLTSAEIKDDNMVDQDDFMKLVRLLPNLNRLVLFRPTFTRFRRRDLSDSSFLSNLTYLHLTSAKRHHEKEVLRGLLILAPRIEYLLLTGYSGDIEAFKQLEVTSLRSLIVKDYMVERALVNEWGAASLTYASYRNLVRLELHECSDSNPPRYQHSREILKAAAPTLQHLKIEYFPIHNVLVLLPLLTSIQYLYVKLPSNNIIPDSFLQSLPQSLKILQGITLTYGVLRSHSESSENLPNLIEIEISGTKFDLSVIPPSLRTLTFAEPWALPEILDEIDSTGNRAILPPHIKQIYWKGAETVRSTFPAEMKARFALIDVECDTFVHGFEVE